MNQSTASRPREQSHLDPNEERSSVMQEVGQMATCSHVNFSQDHLQSYHHRYFLASLRNQHDNGFLHGKLVLDEDERERKRSAPWDPHLEHHAQLRAYNLLRSTRSRITPISEGDTNCLSADNMVQPIFSTHDYQAVSSHAKYKTPWHGTSVIYAYTTKLGLRSRTHKLGRH